MNEKEKKLQELLDGGLFTVKSITGVNHDPHPFTVGPRHVAIAADHFSGILGEPALDHAESKGITCAYRGCNLPRRHHKYDTVAFIQITRNLSNREAAMELSKAKEWCEANGIDGFGFVDDDNGYRIAPPEQEVQDEKIQD